MPTQSSLVRYADAIVDELLATPSITIRFDYGVRTDTNPVYVGMATPQSSITDTASKDWTIKFFQYDGTNRVTSITFANRVAWANRIAITYQ
jgi:hypothetical protein